MEKGKEKKENQAEGKVKTNKRKKGTDGTKKRDLAVANDFLQCSFIWFIIVLLLLLDVKVVTLFLPFMCVCVCFFFLNYFNGKTHCKTN